MNDNDKNIKMIELSWNSFEMNLYIIYSFLGSLDYFCLDGCDDVKKDIYKLIDKIENRLGLNFGTGDIIAERYKMITCFRKDN